LTLLPDDSSPGYISFDDTSTADHATITAQPEPPGVFGFPGILFLSHSSAGNATVIAQGAISNDTSSPQIDFEQHCDAANATVIAYGGSNGGNGGVIFFTGTPNGGTARIELFGNSILDTTLTHGVQLGSVEGEGEGTIELGASQLQVGTNNLSTVFSGLIEDNGDGGSFVKVGTGVLTLSGPNTYTGATTVKAGTLVVTNTAGSATGTGSVSVNAGTLGGSGTVAGALTVGTGSGAGAFLAPAAGTTIQTRLTVQSAVTLNSDATYTYTFKANSKHARTDMVIANGATITGATFALVGTTQGRMKRGLVLNVINNTSANPISGTFSNLPDGAIVTVNGNNLQASYEGGDGNDLTLTVVP
jgi:autotransporter-associated beta strand protein